MLITDETRLAGKLACPACKSPLRLTDGDGQAGWTCENQGCALSGPPFPRLHGKSVLVDFDNSILDREATLSSGAASMVRREGGGWRAAVNKLIYGRNDIAPHFARRIVSGLEAAGRESGEPSTILIVGGGAIGSGADALYESNSVGLVAFDIYDSHQITFVADGHSIPLADGSIDAVWIQAVLEHVANPAEVVEEIRRVLKPGGLVFADTPFMWPVHEKAFDFTRWTPSGHRWLFRHFDVLAAGTSSGPGTLCVLSIRYLAAALLRSWTLGDLAALPFFWLRYLDRFCDPQRALDAAAGIFLFGRKTETPLDIARLPAFYDEQAALEEQVRTLA